MLLVRFEIVLLKFFIVLLIIEEFFFVMGIGFFDLGIGMFVNFDGDLIRLMLEFDRYLCEIVVDGGFIDLLLLCLFFGEVEEGYVFVFMVKEFEDGLYNGLEI